MAWLTIYVPWLVHVLCVLRRWFWYMATGCVACGPQRTPVCWAEQDGWRHYGFNPQAFPQQDRPLCWRHERTFQRIRVLEMELLDA